MTSEAQMTIAETVAPPTAPKVRLTAADVEARIKRRFAAPEHIHYDEISPPGSERRADMLCVSLWESRGQLIHGFEIKVDRRDWLNELKSPAKADPIVRMSHRFWLASANGAVAADEVPEQWGWLECVGDRLMTRKKAPALAGPEITLRLLCMFLRREQRLRDEWLRRYTPNAEIEEEVERRVSHAVEHDTASAKRYRAMIEHTQEDRRRFEAQFAAKTGMTPESFLRLLTESEVPLRQLTWAAEGYERKASEVRHVIASLTEQGGDQPE